MQVEISRSQAVLHGEPVFPENVVKEGVQQSFLDARADPSESGFSSNLKKPNPEFRMLIHYPLFQEDDELDVGIRPGFFDEDQSEGEDALEELSRSRWSGSNSRPSPAAGSEHGRNVRVNVEPHCSHPVGNQRVLQTHGLMCVNN